VTARPVITLLTDFGHADPFVGMMKGVIAGICPEANVVDLTHEVPAQDVFSGAFFLERSFRYVPAGTVHVAVVDPGVGTRRAALALAAQGHVFVGPDNGLLSRVGRRFRAVRLTERSFFRADHAPNPTGSPAISNTFHGRDVFAPVAAHLAGGVPLARLGPAKKRIVELSWPEPRKTRSGLSAEVISVDHFGNLITNIAPREWNALRRPRLSAGAFVCEALSDSYRAARPRGLVAVFGGYGLLEIAARDASAASLLGLTRGARVRVDEA
jgi:S-adenosylmethionine hydrolase